GSLSRSARLSVPVPVVTWLVLPVLIWLVVLLSFLEFRSHGGAAGIDPNGQSHGDGVGEASQIHAFAICLECENVAAQRHNLHLQAYVVDDPLKLKPSVGILFERARRNRYGERPNLQGHVFR